MIKSVNLPDLYELNDVRMVDTVRNHIRVLLQHFRWTGFTADVIWVGSKGLFTSFSLFRGLRSALG